MKKETWKTIIQVIVSILTAALTALGTTSCMGFGYNNIEEISNQENKQKVNASIIEAIFSENMAVISAEIENFDNAKGDENIDKIKLYAKEKERLEQNKTNIVSQITQYNTELESCEIQEKKEKEEINKLQEEIEKLKQTKEQNEKNKQTILQKVK